MASYAYRTMEPEDSDPVWGVLRQMAQTEYERLARLLSAVHDFEADPQERHWDRAACMKIAPKDRGPIEAYLVPSLYDEASALLRVRTCNPVEPVSEDMQPPAKPS